VLISQPEEALDMPNDAKLGLIVGVVVVVAVAVVFFRKDGPNAFPLTGEATAAVNPQKQEPARSAQRLTRPVKAKPTAQDDGTVNTVPTAAESQHPAAPADDDSNP
jgi:hypothetical protein